jgi:hypothetical protein
MNENAQWQMIKDSVLFALSSGFSVSLFGRSMNRLRTNALQNVQQHGCQPEIN